jgi:hypothetical protein
MNRHPKMSRLIPASQGAARNGEAIAPVTPESGNFMANAPPSSSRSDPARAPRRSTVEPARCAGRKPFSKQGEAFGCAKAHHSRNARDMCRMPLNGKGAKP